MKKVIVVFLLAFCFNTLNGQKVEKKDWHFNLGSGLGVYNGLNSINTQSSVGSVSLVTQLGVEYFFEERLSLGISVRQHSFLPENNPTTEFNEAFGGGWYFTNSYYFFKRPKFVSYGRVMLGQTENKFVVTNPQLNSTGKLGFGGFTYGLQLGFKKYFGKIIGLFFQVNYTKHNLVIRSMVSDGTTFTEYNNVKVGETRIFHNGAEAQLGLTIAI